MDVSWAHAAPSVLAAFFASLVECVEALTIVLAIGSVRGWRSALGGSGAALILLLAIVAAVGPALARIPIGIVQITVGTLLLLFGMRWLRKAILRAVGVVPLHDETAAFAKETARLRALGGGGRLDMAAALASFQITMLEGIEVVFIVLAIGAGGAGLLAPASLGALAALLRGACPRSCHSSPAREHPGKQSQVCRRDPAFRVRHILGRRRSRYLLAGR